MTLNPSLAVIGGDRSGFPVGWTAMTHDPGPLAGPLAGLRVSDARSHPVTGWGRSWGLLGPLTDRPGVPGRSRSSVALDMARSWARRPGGLHPGSATMQQQRGEGRQPRLLLSLFNSVSKSSNRMGLVLPTQKTTVGNYAATQKTTVGVLIS
jgi:hypothetical protein